MKQERTDGESAKAVREQVLLLRYKLEPGIVESFCFQICILPVLLLLSLVFWLKTENTLIFLEEKEIIIFLKSTLICILV